MGLSWAVEDRSRASRFSDFPEDGIGRYRARAPGPSGRILWLNIEVPVPSASSLAFLLPIVVLHVAVAYVLAMDGVHGFARKIAPIKVQFLQAREHEPPPEPPLLSAAALMLDATPLVQIVPPSLSIDAFESETKAITAGPLSAKKTLPEKNLENIEADEEEGTFVRPRPVKGRRGGSAYPSGAAAAKESGRATVKICITARGKVESVEIVESTGFARLDNDALDVARQYEFRPATRNGKPVPVCLPYSVTYRIR